MPTSVRPSPEIEQRLEDLAWKTGRSKAQHLPDFVERGLEDLEDYYLAAEVQERIRLGEESVVSAENFWYGLDSMTNTERGSLAGRPEERG
ncbi:CopG family transcriptional regulator [Mesorhizobium sp. M1C.F.Ca.ET.193.01.1.1]|uniref:type II toxin-antitoxin system RelB family antitoxin n=1 Tax=unclassified Mesorhizobium TaxID=325217 RepID=UPI000FD5D44A|nr:MULTISPECIES: CopG family transcriptional regulator [unclassified Mesorhizobium]TGS95669.1 CopG family transcriptional regulator [bacterium M00.F.Ca.ET.177.01.1.1]RWA73309.1 MAG: CopG family transcriptional regulator [Mesorhizobium sp.]RWC01823.1 MAG: CopG family transcriptional regulator [Mesorhizobium sp.]RWG84105.1 MAG: CopG family transcriptional regulator [Mesorhizobium sp.]RWG86306.1 MAG: CopG family transcriptional regulator [Mesorhizobium sp.]